MKKEKIREVVKVAIPAIMVLSRTWTATASVGGNVKPTAADVAAFRNQETQQEQPAETAFMQGEDSEGEVYLARANGCKAECMASCEGKCEWNCGDACTGTCKTKCTGTCKSGCTIVCADTCNYNCKGDCTSKNWDR